MNANQIIQCVKFCCKELDLPFPIIKIMDEGISFGPASCYYENKKITLTFILHRLTKTMQEIKEESIWSHIKYTPTQKWEYGFFVVAHEMAHALQYHRHWMWLATYVSEMDRYLKKYKKFSFQKYNDLKVEANANKIALILLKRAKRNKFKLDK